MERPIKGGYILISLGLIALSTSYSGSIDYDRISKTKKHIVLTGIKVGSEVKPDITVKPIYGSGTITFKDVYGFDIEVASDNTVTVTYHEEKIYTQLYTHEIANVSGAIEEVLYIKSNIKNKATNMSSLLNLYMNSVSALVVMDEENFAPVTSITFGENSVTFGTAVESISITFSTVINDAQQTPIY